MEGLESAVRPINLRTLRACGGLAAWVQIIHARPQTASTTTVQQEIGEGQTRARASSFAAPLRRRRLPPRPMRKTHAQPRRPADRPHPRTPGVPSPAVYETLEGRTLFAGGFWAHVYPG